MQQNPMHTYSVAGNDTVKLTGSNVNGTDSKTGNISVVKEEKTSKKDKDVAWSNPGGDWYDRNGVLGSTPYTTLP